MKFSGLVRSVFVVLVLLVIALMANHRYTMHKRYENISRFDYLPKDGIDYSYYDQAVLNTYFTNCTKLTDLAKMIWLKHGVDILTTKTAYGETQSAINRYNVLLKYTKALESRLSESKDLRDQGLDNDDIEMILDKGLTIGAAESERDKVTTYDFLKGKNVSSRSPRNEIWELQKLLNDNDYNLSINGIFDAATDSALQDFQHSENIYPSHVCDDLTLKKLTE